MWVKDFNREQREDAQTVGRLADTRNSGGEGGDAGRRDKGEKRKGGKA